MRKLSCFSLISPTNWRAVVHAFLLRNMLWEEASDLLMDSASLSSFPVHQERAKDGSHSYSGKPSVWMTVLWHGGPLAWSSLDPPFLPEEDGWMQADCWMWALARDNFQISAWRFSRRALAGRGWKRKWDCFNNLRVEIVGFQRRGTFLTLYSLQI